MTAASVMQSTAFTVLGTTDQRCFPRPTITICNMPNFIMNKCTIIRGYLLTMSDRFASTFDAADIRQGGYERSDIGGRRCNWCTYC